MTRASHRPWVVLLALAAMLVFAAPAGAARKQSRVFNLALPKPGDVSVFLFTAGKAGTGAHRPKLVIPQAGKLPKSITLLEGEIKTSKLTAVELVMVNRRPPSSPSYARAASVDHTKIFFDWLFPVFKKLDNTLLVPPTPKPICSYKGLSFNPAKFKFGKLLGANLDGGNQQVGLAAARIACPPDATPTPDLATLRGAAWTPPFGNFAISNANANDIVYDLISPKPITDYKIELPAGYSFSTSISQGGVSCVPSTTTNPNDTFNCKETLAGISSLQTLAELSPAPVKAMAISAAVSTDGGATFQPFKLNYWLPLGSNP